MTHCEPSPKAKLQQRGEDAVSVHGLVVMHKPNGKLVGNESFAASGYAPR